MKTKIIRTISLILLISTFIIIFIFSNQNGEQSSNISQNATQTITQTIFNQEISTEQLEYIIRKFAHFSIYALVGILSMIFFNTFNLKQRNKSIATLIIGITYASTDEFHQSFIPGRSAQIKDVCIDTAGVLFGIISVLIIIWIIKKIKHYFNKIQIKIESNN